MCEYLLRYLISCVPVVGNDYAGRYPDAITKDQYLSAVDQWRAHLSLRTLMSTQFSIG